MNVLYLSIYTLFIIMIVLIGLYHHYYTKCNATKDNKNAFEISSDIKETFENDDPYIHGASPVISPNNYNNSEWLSQSVSSNNPDIQDIPIDHKLTLTKSLDNPFKAYNLGIIDYKKMTTPIISSKDELDKFGDFNNIGLSQSKLYSYNKNTWKNIANKININKNIKVSYIKSKINAINKINKEFLKEFNNNQYLIADKELVMKNSIHEYMIYGYKIEKVLSDNKKPPQFRYQIILNLIKRESYYNPVIFIDALYDKNSDKVYFYKVDFIGQFNTSKTLLQKGYNKNSYEEYDLLSPIYKSNMDIINDIDTIIKDKETYNKDQKLTSQYACFNTSPKIMDDEYGLYKNYSVLKEYTLLNYHDKQDCEKKYNMLGKPKKSGVWDRPCEEDEDCPFYKSNKNYDNNFGRCDKSTGECKLPLNMVNIGYHYYYEEKDYEPLCYNCNSNTWLPNTNLGKCCEKQKNKDKYPFLNGPDYAFKHDFQERTNNYLKKNCYLKSEGKKKVNNNIICKQGSYDMF